MKPGAGIKPVPNTCWPGLNRQSAEGEPTRSLACQQITASANVYRQKVYAAAYYGFFHFTDIASLLSPLKNYIHRDDHAHEIAGSDILPLPEK
jgi:hypothetical protein